MISGVFWSMRDVDAEALGMALELADILDKENPYCGGIDHWWRCHRNALWLREQVKQELLS